jgi:probable HAF family extracellular repeat protein
MKSRFETWSIAAVTIFALSVVMAAQDSTTPSNPRHQTYQLIDLGTFGGPNSFFNGSAPPMLNNGGAAAGEADTSITCAYLPEAGLASPGFRWKDGVLTNIGAIGNGCFNLPNAMNSNEVIAGAADIGVIDPMFGPLGHGYAWSKGQTFDVGTFGGPFSLANGVNERGQVTGGASNLEPDPWGCAALVGLPSPTVWHAFVWQGGVLTDLGTLGGPCSLGAIINDPGQVTGYSFANDVPNPTTGIPTVAPFLWDRGRMINVGTLGGVFGFGNSVNNRGQVVGFSDVAGDLANHPFFWEGGVLTNIGTLGGTNGSASWINDGGQVIGTADLADGTHHAFIWRNGRMTDLGTVGNDPCSNGFHINASGQAIGTSTDCHGNILHAFLWDNGSMMDLSGQVLPGSGFAFIEPVVINERGEIAGNAVFPTGEMRAVILQPNGVSSGFVSETGVTPAFQTRSMAMTMTARQERNASTPLERVRNNVRQRYHLPGQPVAPRD